MNCRGIAVPLVVLARIGAANIFVLTLLTPCWTHSSADPGPAQAGPAEAPTADTSKATNSQAMQVAHHPSAPSAVQPGMHVERQVLSPSGNLRIEYLRDRQRGIRQISLKDAHNAANTAILAQYKRNAWVVVSPDDQWIVLNNRDGTDSGAQIYHRGSAVPLKYAVPDELRANGSGLQDLVWQSYLEGTQQDPNTERSRVTIDGIAWQPDSHHVSISVAPIASKNDEALPEPWTCTYDVATKQVEAPADVAEGPANQSETNAPNESTNWESQPAAATGESDTTSADEQSYDMDGDRFPATREEQIRSVHANQL